MFIRRQYLNKECTHREYYAQFVTDGIKALVKKGIGVETLKKSNDEHLNDIPLSKWDALGYGLNVRDKMKECNDFPSMAGKICILKEAARQIAEE